MKKNVAGQKIGAQLVSATDGSAFTSAVTVEVTLDAGTQATGSVGSGACTHEGNGYHTYAPAQAETNGDLVAFTFHGTGAVPVTVQIYTTFPQTVDNATNISSIKTKTDFLPAATAGAPGGVFIAGANAATSIATALTANIVGNITGALSGSVGSVTAGVTLAAAAVQAIWDALTTALTTSGSIGKRIADFITGDAFARLGAPVGVSHAADVATVKVDTAAIKVKTDSLTFTQAGQVDANVQRINDVAITGDGSATPFGV